MSENEQSKTTITATTTPKLCPLRRYAKPILTHSVAGTAGIFIGIAGSFLFLTYKINKL